MLGEPWYDAATVSNAYALALLALLNAEAEDSTPNELFPCHPNSAMLCSH